MLTKHGLMLAVALACAQLASAPAAADPRTRLEQLYAVRDPLYRDMADLIVDTGRQSANSLVTELIPQIEKTCGQSA